MRAHHGYCGRVMPVSVSGEGGSLKTWMCDPIYSIWGVSPCRLWMCDPWYGIWGEVSPWRWTSEPRCKLWEGFMLKPMNLRCQV